MSLLNRDDMLRSSSELIKYIVYAYLCRNEDINKKFKYLSYKVITFMHRYMLFRTFLLLNHFPFFITVEETHYKNLGFVSFQS